MPATISTVLTNARLSSCAPVNTSNVGAERGEQVRRARADQADEDEPAAAPAVGERDGDQRHEHAGPRDAERDAEGLVGAAERAGDRVTVLGEQGAAEVGEQCDRGERAEPGGLLRGERDRRDNREAA